MTPGVKKGTSPTGHRQKKQKAERAVNIQMEKKKREMILRKGSTGCRNRKEGNDGWKAILLGIMLLIVNGDRRRGKGGTRCR